MLLAVHDVCIDSNDVSQYKLMHLTEVFELVDTPSWGLVANWSSEFKSPSAPNINKGFNP